MMAREKGESANTDWSYMTNWRNVTRSGRLVRPVFLKKGTTLWNYKRRVFMLYITV